MKCYRQKNNFVVITQFFQAHSENNLLKQISEHQNDYYVVI